jgi:methionyl-tRNA formyltransferase
LLPKYRGASPIQSSLINGDIVSGVTFIKMNADLDAGEIIDSFKCDISINDNKISLEKKLTKISIERLNEVLGNVKSNNISLNHQDESKASYCKKIKKIDGLINFNQSSQLIFNTFRAYKEWPQSTFEYKKILIKIHDMYISDKQSGGVPGTISLLDKTGIYINTCDKMIVITNLQFPNKKIISAVDVFNSYKEFFS